MKRCVILVSLLFVLLTATLIVGCTEARLISFEHDVYTLNSERVFTPVVRIAPKSASYEIFSSNNTIAVATGKEVTTVKEGVVTLTVVAGEKQATCTLYVKNDKEYGGNEATIAERVTVSFSIVNYELAGLATGNLSPVSTIKNSYLSINEPFVNGYRVNGWYKDRACTDFFDIEREKISGNITLYARLTERENSFTVVNKLVTGLTYPNLDHAHLVFPEKDSNGNEVIGIADKAFYGDKNIVTVEIPANYVTIGDAAFAGCKNLTTVEIGTDSKLEVVGLNAFGMTQDKENTFLEGCTALSSVNLPDSVRRVGAFAFYGAAALSFESLPKSLKKLEQYAFAGTKTGDLSLRYVTEIFEGAFADCKAMKAVTETEGVIYCDKLVFSGTALLRTEQEKFEKTGKDADALYYANTILIGCLPRFGILLGSGKVHITEETTLIANEAFDDTELSPDKKPTLTELTVYLDTVHSREAIAKGNYFIGKNAFLKASGVAIVVGDGEFSLYRSLYTADGEDVSYDFRGQICTERVITVAGTRETSNAGTHTLLRFLNAGGNEYYHYEKYSFDAETLPGGAGRISLKDLRTSQNLIGNIRRINSLSLSGIGNLLWLELADTDSIAYMGISKCANIESIRLDASTAVVKLESISSIQFSSLNANCYVYVKASNLDTYQREWEGTTALTRLRAV